MNNIDRSEHIDRLFIIVVSGAAGHQDPLNVSAQGDIKNNIKGYNSHGQMPEAWVINSFIEDMVSNGVEPYIYFVDPSYYTPVMTDRDRQEINDYNKFRINIINSTISDFMTTINHQVQKSDVFPLAFVDYIGLGSGYDIAKTLHLNYLNPHIVYLAKGCKAPNFNPYELTNSDVIGYDIVNNKFNRVVYDYRQAGKMSDLMDPRDRYYVLTILADMTSRARVYNPINKSIPRWAQVIPDEISQISGTLEDLTPKQIYENLINYLHMFIRNNYKNVEPPEIDIPNSKLLNLQTFLLEDRKFK